MKASLFILKSYGFGNVVELDGLAYTCVILASMK